MMNTLTLTACSKSDSMASWDEVAAQTRQAQQRWAAQSVGQRLAVIRRWRHLIAERADALAQTLPESANRSRADTLVAEVLPLADACRFLEREAKGLLAPVRLHRRPLWMRGVVAEVQRQPWGVVLIIAPSNYPLLLPGVQLVQALVAGNAVLLKPGVGGLAAALILKQLLVTAGLDAALVHVLPEAPEAAMRAIEGIVDKVVLTGSTETGTQILASLAPHLTPAIMELSGCDTAFVRPDANLDLVISALAFSLRWNGGATCIAPRRVFVPPPLLAGLTHRLADRVRDLGPFDVGPSDFELARQLVQQACQSGARLVCGGFEDDDRMRPIVLTDVTPDMAVLRTAVMAPVLSLMHAADDNAALEADACCPYALGVVVFGQEKTARDLAAQVRAGVVLINDVIVPTADPRLPFGGLGRSGYGVTRGAEGLLEMTAVKALSVRRGHWRPHYEPPHPGHADLFRAYIQAVHSASWRLRGAAIWLGLRMLTQLPRPKRRSESREGKR
jgi:acyl-CoA reductase-like NAD-dependent aldehyde dehydrogenase